MLESYINISVYVISYNFYKNKNNFHNTIHYNTVCV